MDPIVVVVVILVESRGVFFFLVVDLDLYLEIESFLPVTVNLGLHSQVIFNL